MIIDPAFAANEDLRDGVIEFLEYIRAAFEVDKNKKSFYFVDLYNSVQFYSFIIRICMKHFVRLDDNSCN